MDEKNDIAAKIGELLSDEESMKQITELAQMFMSGSADGSVSDTGEAAAPSAELPDIAGLISLAGAASKGDKNTELLLALRPHLSPRKRERIDKAVKLLRLLAVWNLAKESGLLKDFI